MIVSALDLDFNLASILVDSLIVPNESVTLIASYPNLLLYLYTSLNTSNSLDLGILPFT